MPKYSTGGSSSGGGGGTCELCGTSTDDLERATVAGAEIEVCSNCAPHGDDDGGGSSGDGGSSGGDDASRRKRAAQNAAKLSDAWSGDSSHWEEEGTDYEEDRLPYLVPDYGERVTRARQDAGLQRDELADEMSLSENDLLAVEQDRANQADVGGSVIFALEERLDIELAEDTD